MIAIWQGSFPNTARPYWLHWGQLPSNKKTVSRQKSQSRQHCKKYDVMGYLCTITRENWPLAPIYCYNLIQVEVLLRRFSPISPAIKRYVLCWILYIPVLSVVVTSYPFKWVLVSSISLSSSCFLGWFYKLKLSNYVAEISTLPTSERERVLASKELPKVWPTVY